MDLIIWFAIGAVSGYIAGVALFEDGGVGVPGHVIVGLLAGVVGGYATAALLDLSNPFDLIYPITFVGAIVMAAVAVVLVDGFTEQQRLGV